MVFLPLSLIPAHQVVTSNIILLVVWNNNLNFFFIATDLHGVSRMTRDLALRQQQSQWSWPRNPTERYRRIRVCP